jgi:hypothetical protein
MTSERLNLTGAKRDYGSVRAADPPRAGESEDQWQARLGDRFYFVLRGNVPPAISNALGLALASMDGLDLVELPERDGKQPRAGA